MTELEREKLAESYRKANKTERIGFRCTAGIREYVEYMSDVLGMSVSDTICYLLNLSARIDSLGDKRSIFIRISPWAKWTKEQAKKGGMDITTYIESLIEKEYKKVKEESGKEDDNG